MNRQLVMWSVLGSIQLASAQEPCYLTSEMTLEQAGSRVCVSSGRYEMADPVTGESKTLGYRFYQSRQAERLPLVLVFPPLYTVDNAHFVERAMARRLAQNGFQALIVDLPEDIGDLQRPLSGINDFFARSNASVDAIFGMTAEWPLFSGETVALGVSLGGIRASIAFNRDPRISTLVTYITGGDLPTVFANTQVKFLKRYRNHWKKRLGLPDDAAFGEHLRGILKYDPVAGASPAKRDSIFMVHGLDDVQVPYANQKLLWEAYGKPRLIEIPAGHRVSGISYLWNFGRVLDFIRQRVRSPVPESFAERIRAAL